LQVGDTVDYEDKHFVVERLDRRRIRRVRLTPPVAETIAPMDVSKA
jgi:CBS domain containing-hemolysin-like protein